jgi:glycine dehydrogenase
MMTISDEKVSATKNLASNFVHRHIGPDERETKEILDSLGVGTLKEFMDRVIPESIRLKKPIQNPKAGIDEHLALEKLRTIAAQNKVFRSFIGLGYHETILPGVIQRNILENPGWYTQYTPYQAEISQGRMEALLNFQTMITDLTGMDIANASMLDESTAAAEAMAICHATRKTDEKASLFIARNCHAQTIEVVRTRAQALGVDVEVGDHHAINSSKSYFAILFQNPGTEGEVEDLTPYIQKAHAQQMLCIVACDILSLTLIKPPGEMGADIVVGNTQRFGMPMGYGGPHAGFLATRDDLKRLMPGRLIGVSKDAGGNPALRLSLQTREQHIRREKATSNICTAQVLPAVVASMYAVYHGPDGLREIAEQMHAKAILLAAGMKRLGHEISHSTFFDTLTVKLNSFNADEILNRALKQKINLRKIDSKHISIALGELTSTEDIEVLLEIFNSTEKLPFILEELDTEKALSALNRTSHFLTHPVFNTHHSETEMLRYIRKLEMRDLSLAYSMIPLGSCTMKLNATSEMMPITWPEFANVHPFAPIDQAKGYLRIFKDLEKWLAEITGFAAVSLQPNAGSQGEYAGLLVIRKYHESRGEGHRNVCLIPTSAHGTNPASAAMAGFEIVGVKCDTSGNIDLADLNAKAEEYKNKLCVCMITYPSTHGVFEVSVKEICKIVHQNGGQVYMDGANMNAQVGLTSPGRIGADVCHLNLHKTFCIPHGGGGPGMGPICVAKHLISFLPNHPVIRMGGEEGVGPISQAPWGSAVILTISWMYMVMMGAEGLTNATMMAILNANYIAKRLESYFPVLYKGANGFVAHECILDFRSLKATCGIEVEDVAKRLIDYGFHAPTMSWPVPGTLMIEPTESEPKNELDRFCDAMIQIHGEIKRVEEGKLDRQNNPLKNSPHTALAVTSDQWNRPYSREEAAFPNEWIRQNKFWPFVGRVDNVYGDRNLFCSCLPVSENGS